MRMRMRMTMTETIDFIASFNDILKHFFMQEKTIKNQTYTNVLFVDGRTFYCFSFFFSNTVFFFFFGLVCLDFKICFLSFFFHFFVFVFFIFLKDFVWFLVFGFLCLRLFVMDSTVSVLVVSNKI